MSFHYYSSLHLEQLFQLDIYEILVAYFDTIAAIAIIYGARDRYGCYVYKLSMSIEVELM